jgi:hypothetical protein
VFTVILDYYCSVFEKNSLLVSPRQTVIYVMCPSDHDKLGEA